MMEDVQILAGLALATAFVFVIAVALWEFAFWQPPRGGGQEPGG